ncbi:MAG: CHAT domain-containing protein, partial [Ornithinimicrobium sp.]
LDWTTEVDAKQVSPTHGPLSPGKIVAAVQQAGVAMLTTFIRGESWHAVLIRPDGALSLHTLGTLSAITGRIQAVQADLNVAARVQPNHPLHHAIRSSLAQRLVEIDEALLAPLTSEGLGASPLVVVPTPVLSLVPWGMLPSRRGRATTVARSATMWGRRHTHLTDLPQVWAGAGPDVPLADGEVSAVVDAWGAGLAVPAAACTTEVLMGAFEQADLVHVAAHGEHHTRNPLFSSLRLDDGSLFAHEIEGRRLRASHVVLSACESGRISVRRGEEALGMTASLLALGVGTVIAAGSPIPDAIAHAVMGDYHRQLAGGVDAATALASATADGDVLGAAFTCFGSSWRYSPPHAAT